MKTLVFKAIIGTRAEGTIGNGTKEPEIGQNSGYEETHQGCKRTSDVRCYVHQLHDNQTGIPLPTGSICRRTIG